MHKKQMQQFQESRSIPEVKQLLYIPGIVAVNPL